MTSTTKQPLSSHIARTAQPPVLLNGVAASGESASAAVAWSGLDILSVTSAFYCAANSSKHCAICSWLGCVAAPAPSPSLGQPVCFCISR